MTEHQKKLNGFPPIFVVSLNESEQRRLNLFVQFQKYKVTDYHFFIVERYHEYGWNFYGRLFDSVLPCSLGPTTSHILINEYWTKNTHHEYVLILEDDVDLDIVELWNFKWKDFVNSLPKDWECVQLSVMTENPDNIQFTIKERYNREYGCQAYLIKRQYAEELARRYRRKDGFFLDMPGADIKYGPDDIQFLYLYPLVENIVYNTIGKVYSIPLFFEHLEDSETTMTGLEKESYREKCRKNLYLQIQKYVF